MILSRIMRTCSLLAFEMTIFRNSIRNGTLSMTKIPSDDILEGLYKLRIRESEKLKTVLELYDLEIHQKKLGPDYHRLKTMVKKKYRAEPTSVRNASRTRSPRGRSPAGKMARLPCKDHLKGTCTTPLCEKWHPPECLFYNTKSGCRFGEKCSYAHRQVDEQPSKRSKKNGDKSAVAVLKITRQLGCAFQDMEPPKSSSILRKRKPIRCVRFTGAVVRHADIRDQNPSLGMICPGDPHQRKPNASKT